MRRALLFVAASLASAQSTTRLPSIPATIAGPTVDEPRRLKSSFEARVNGRLFVVTTHVAADTPGAVSVWSREPSGFRLAHRLDHTEYVIAEPVTIGGRQYIHMIGCVRHCGCDWALARIERDGRLTVIGTPVIPAKPLLRPGEDLFGPFLDDAEKLSFIAYVCPPGPLGCRLGDMWTSDEYWGKAGPKVVAGRMAIRRNALKIVAAERKKWDGAYAGCRADATVY